MKSIALLLAVIITLSASAQENSPKPWNLHFQATYIYQYKPTFHSPYSGANSLTGKEEKQNSLTATLYAGLKLWKGASVYVNPELAGGSGLSGALGMGGSSNGETFRVGDPAPTLYLARAYLQQTIAIGKKMEDVDEEANELGGSQPANYVEFRVGKFSLGDVFDNNEYSNAPRVQFMNWSLMNNGAWDYAANVRGYTYGFTAALQLNGFSLRGAIALLPEVANGPELNGKINKSFSLNIEAGREFRISNRPGNLRLLYFTNKAAMGNYDKSISLAGAGVPDITATRSNGRTKQGVGLNYDQQVGKYTGLFARAGWNDGANETWCFTEIDQTLTAGISLDGSKWKRKNDNVGIALLANGLSGDHRRYLARGGYGFIVGDGKLNYAPEYATELYYSFKPVVKDLWITADYQFMVNPAYNKDRGPVSIFSLRLHVEL
jgi:high affinity Mn2+ porin